MIHTEILTKITKEDSFKKHYTILELLDILRRELLSKVNESLREYDYSSIDKYNHIIEECNNWQQMKIVEEES